MTTEYHGGSVAGGTFPAEIWGDYMKQAKGKFCGDFKPAKTPAHFTPFYGKYARGGGRNTGDDQRDAFGNPRHARRGRHDADDPRAHDARQRARRTRASSTRTSTSPRRRERRREAPGPNDPGGGAEAPTG